MSLATKYSESDALHHDDQPVVVHARVVTGTGGGPDKTILNSPRYLPAHGYRAICAYLYPPDDPGIRELEKRAAQCGAAFFGIPDRGPWDWRVATSMLRLCRREKVSVWHGHDYKSNVLGLLLRRCWPMRLVTTVHGWGVVGGRRRLYYAIDRLALRHYERVICVSDDLMRQCIRSGVPSTHCRIVENAIDLRQYSRCAPREAAKCRLGIPPGRTVIGAVGRLSPEKGFHHLITAFHRLLLAGYDGHLCVVGDGPDHGRLRRAVEQLSLDDRVTLPGYQDHTIDWYQAMDVYALSSLREGLPNVLLEAMACEIPVVATRIAGVPNLVQHRDNGLLIEPDDVDGLTQALVLLFSDPGLRSRLGKEGRVTVERKYDFSLRMQRICGIYDELLGRPCSSP